MSTMDQRIALAERVLESKPVRHHLEAELGFGNVPKDTSQLTTDSKEVLEQYEGVFQYLSNAFKILLTTTENRERQGEIDLPERKDIDA